MIYILIPVFNERPNIQSLKDDLANLPLSDHRFYLFVDDCSNDGTVGAIHDAFRDEAYHIIEKDQNVGPGDSFNQGFNWVLQKSNSPKDLVVTMEGDNTADLTTLPRMLTIAGLGFDLVLASVYTQGGVLDKTSVFRKLLSFGANMMLRTLLGLRTSTVSSFYRVYQTALLQKLSKTYPQGIIEEKGYISMVEVLVKGVRTGASVIEVPTVLLSEKRQGTSKMKIRKTLVEYVRFILKSKALHNPRHKKGRKELKIA